MFAILKVDSWFAVDKQLESFFSKIHLNSIILDI